MNFSTTKITVIATILFALTSQFVQAGITNAKGEVVGMVDGQFQVTPNGAATYTIPLKIPKGISGVQPDLALAYNSQGGNGMLGMGWSLSGLSAIYRCPKNLAQDNQVRGVKFDSSDALCLDGQRLVLVSGTHFQNNAEYRTEIDNFARVTYNGTYFTVKSKDGLTKEYNARAWSVNASNSQMIGVKSWALSSVSDIVGNRFTIQYHTYLYEGEQVPNEITYTHTVNTAPIHTIKFNYDTTLRPDVIVGYRNGAKNTMSERLRNIEIKQNGLVIKRYKFIYDNSKDLQERSFLTDIQECGYNSSSTESCVPPTNFDWYQADHKLTAATWTVSNEWGGDGYTWTGDFDGNGLTDIASAAGGNVFMKLSNGTGFNPATWTVESAWGGAGYTWTGDFNGDGLTDIASASGSNIYMKLSNGSGFDSETWTVQNSWTVGLGRTAYGWGAAEYTWTGDFNGDGLTDIASASGGNIYTYLSNGDRFEYIVRGVDNLWGGAGHTKTGDFNGDGLTDIASASGSNIYMKLSNGNGFDSRTWTVPNSWTVPLNKTVYGWGAAEYTWAGDFNGDGLTDIASASGGNIYMYLARGDGFEYEIWNVPSAWGISNLTWARDFNGDGLMDIASANEGEVYLKISTGDGFKPETWLDLDSWKWAKIFNWTYFYIRTGDFNGDGIEDIAAPNHDSIYMKLSNSDYHGILKSATNGLGTNTEVQYKRLIDPAVYIRTPLCQGVEYPERCVISPMPVVSMQQTDDGVGGKASLTYQYKDAYVHLRGRGWLGFTRSFTTDQSTGLVTTNGFDFLSMIDLYPNDGSGYNNDTYVYNGMSVNSMVYHQDQFSNTIHSSISYLDHKVIAHEKGKTYFPYVGTEEEKAYEIPYGNSYTFESTTKAYDNYGNVTSIVVSNQSQDTSLVTTTINEYGTSATDVDGKRLGRLKSATVTAALTEYSGSFADHKTQTRRTDYTYYDNGHGLLESAIEEKDDFDKTIAQEEESGPNLYLKTTYFYDDYGNKKEVKIEGSPNAKYPITARQTLGSYDYTGLTSGQYTVTTTNAEDLSETKTIDPRYGLASKLTGPNNLDTDWWYDVFGRKARETRADNTETEWTYYWCENNTKCPHYAVYYITTTNHVKNSAGQHVSPPKTVYYDKLGRELRSETIGLNKMTVLKDIQYNELGQVWRESRPYFANVIPDYWTTYTYDLKGRVTRTVHPDGSVTKTNYNGLETELIRERRGENGYTAIRNKQIKNALGKVEWVIDALGNGTRYTYYPFGELESTTDPMGNVMFMYYDKRGRKIRMDDPDMGYNPQNGTGYWEYAHDALGNLRWQKDAKGQEVYMAYDDLNRMVSRIDNYNTTYAEETEWTYFDSAAALGSRGKLEKIHRAADNYTESYGYDPKGRPTTTTTSFSDAPTVLASYVVTTVYDQYYSRVDHVVYPASNDRGTTRLFRKKNIYDTYGYLIKVVDQDQQSNVFWEPVFANADGKITLEVLNNRVVTTARSFNPALGFIESISTGKGSANNIQDWEYFFDSLGNLERRVDYNRRNPLTTGTGLEEHLHYDGINRLTSIHEKWLSGTNTAEKTIKHYQYDAIGNITFNSDVGYYHYDTIDSAGNHVGPHAVTRIERLNTVTSNTPGNANADEHINSLDTHVTSEYMVGATQPEGNADCQSNSNINIHDVPCIADRIGSQGGGDVGLEYDRNGNTLTGYNGKSLRWTSFNKPEFIGKGTTQLTFSYGPNRNRYKQVEDKNGQLTTIHYVGGLFEKITDKDGNTQYKNYIDAGGRTIAVRTYYSNKSANTRFIHRDHMGSTDAITDENGVVQERSAFEPFGKRKIADWKDGMQSALNLHYTTNATMRQFTGHEDLNGVGLTHMNGRVYDPELGRFLSPDPHVQFSHDPQSFNRYSYVMNNPLSYTDPSGYFLKKLMKKAMGFLRQYGRTIIAIAATVYLGPVIGGFISGYISGGNLRSAFIGMATGIMFSGLHNLAPGLGKIFAHGMVGGMSSVMNGGDFKSGFMAAAFTQAIGYAGAKSGNSIFVKAPEGMDRIGNAVKAAIIGGTASVIGGGKFKNGAITGAFSRMFNDDLDIREANAKEDRWKKLIDKQIEDYKKLERLEAYKQELANRDNPLSAKISGNRATISGNGDGADVKLSVTVAPGVSLSYDLHSGTPDVSIGPQVSYGGVRVGASVSVKDTIIDLGSPLGGVMVESAIASTQLRIKLRWEGALVDY